mmetsp:Transcript_11365/g.42420  ORF Transcript_11365/g.42420 Transcript_11365/m.42420 type:complete len:224 (-) Transcript_11365:744-1415(-)
MARFLADNPGLVANRSVLDLGTGTGVAGIAAVAIAGAGRCLLTDVKDCEAIAKQSLRLNAEFLPDGSCTFSEFDWAGAELPEDVAAVLQTDRPVVLISDCLYQFRLLKLLLRLLRKLLNPNTLLIWTYKVRIIEREAAYVEVLQSPVEEGGAGLSFYRANWDVRQQCHHNRFSDVSVVLSALRGGPADAELSERGDVALAPFAGPTGQALAHGWQEHLQEPTT